MNTLIDRMITRVQRPISPVEPLLSQLYAPRLNGLLESTDPAPAFRPLHESHFPNASNHSNVGKAQTQQTQDASDPQPLRQSSEQRLANALRFDTASYDPQPPALPSTNTEQLSSPSQRHQQETLTTRIERPMRDAAPLVQEVPEKEHAQVAKTRHATLLPQNEGIKKAERNGVQDTAANRLHSATTEVNISIGHIEVRAIQRAEPVRRSVSPSHVTLDDYLRRRPGASQ